VTKYILLIVIFFVSHFVTDVMADERADEAKGAHLLFSNVNENIEEELNNVQPSVGVETTEAVQENNLNFSKDAPVDLESDRVEYDEVSGVVTAIGNVELVQSGRILRAERVRPTGDTYFADSVDLKDKMKDGFVTGLTGVLSDGSRFSAKEGQKIADLKVIMSQANYTACDDAP